MTSTPTTMTTPTTGTATPRRTPTPRKPRRGTFGTSKSSAVLTDVQAGSYLDLLDAIAARPSDVPCLNTPGVDWLSDDQAEADAAAAACATCPALSQCQAYVASHRQEAGTWAGRTAEHRSRRWRGTGRAPTATSHCGQGHELTVENTYTSPPGYQQCRVCRRETQRARKARLTASETRDRPDTQLTTANPGGEDTAPRTGYRTTTPAGRGVKISGETGPGESSVAQGARVNKLGGTPWSHRSKS